DARVVAVHDSPQQWAGRTAARSLANGEAREGGCGEMAVALGPHALLADRGGARAPDGGRVFVCPEDGDLVRLHPAVAECRVGREGRQAATDDRAAHGATEGTWHATRAGETE